MRYSSMSVPNPNRAPAEWQSKRSLPEHFAFAEGPGSQPAEVIVMRASALTTFLNSRRPIRLSRVHVAQPGVPQSRDYTGPKTEAEAVQLHKQFNTILTIMTQTISDWAPKFGTREDAGNYWWADDQQKVLSPAALSLFNEAWGKASAGVISEMPAPVVELTGVSEGPVSISEMTPLSGIFRPAIDPALPPSPVQAPAADKVELGQLLARIEQKKKMVADSKKADQPSGELRVSDVLTDLALGKKKKTAKKGAGETG